jgi:hypothetical protein
MTEPDKPVSTPRDYSPRFPNARSPKWVFWYQVLSFGWYQLYWFYRNLRHFHAHKNYDPDSFNYFLMLPIWVFGWPFLVNFRINYPVYIASIDFSAFIRFFVGLIFAVGFTWLYYLHFEIIKSYLTRQEEKEDQFPKNFALVMGLAFMLEFYLSYSWTYSIIYLIGPVIMGFVMMRVQRILNQIWEDHVDKSLEGPVSTRVFVLDQVILLFVIVIPILYWFLIYALMGVDWDNLIDEKIPPE